VHVTLLVPSLIASSTVPGAASINLPENSLYGALRAHVSARLVMSGSAPAMPTAEFAQHAVDQLLSRHPPRYISLGALAWQARVLWWLPRSLVLFLLWFQFFKLPSILAALGIVRG
jgi:1-acylglycerone phosphate reductase